MHDQLKENTRKLQRKLSENGIGCALLTDEDSIAYFAGAWGYLGMEFGRPTMMLVPQEGECILITPLMESAMVAEMTWVEDVRPWEDGDREWDTVLANALVAERSMKLGVEAMKLHPRLAACLDERYPDAQRIDIADIIGDIRMIKSPSEIEIMRQAGQVAIAMVEAGKAALGEGVPEYEVALAINAAGTRKAATYLEGDGLGRFVSPTIHNLQVLQSGHDTSMVHRRSSVRELKRGDPIYMCFCGMIDFKNYKLGFDREFFIGSVTDEQARTYETTIAAQGAALEAIRPGVTAEEVHFAANEVYRTAGFAQGYRTGRALGYSNLEKPELKVGDHTVLQEGMTFAVDGGITVDGQYGTRVGDSVVVTKDGFEYFTPFPKDLCVV